MSLTARPVAWAGGTVMAYEDAGPASALPPAVLLSGMGVAASGWWEGPDAHQRDRVLERPWAGPALLPALAARRRVLTYDRAGLGASTPPHAPRSPDDYLAELAAVLDALDVRGPALLVGHSLGGLLAYAWARRCPERVAGLLLLDPSHPQQGLHLGTGGAAAPGEVRHPEWPDRTRLFRGGVPAPAPGDLGALPLTVLSRGRWQTPEQVRRRVPGSTLTQQDLDHRAQVMARLHAEYAAASSCGRRLVARGSGHFIHLDRPGLCLAAVRCLEAQAPALACAPGETSASSKSRTS